MWQNETPCQAHLKNVPDKEIKKRWCCSIAVFVYVDFMLP